MTESSYFNNDLFSHIEKDISLMERSFTWYFELRFISSFTSRYLTLLTEYSVLPHSFFFKSPSNFFCLDLKITISASFYTEWSFIYI